jgi:predicted ribosome-associated RNA-binding protein Tma20
MLLSLMPMALAAGADKFTDVPADAWYRADVSYDAEHGYFNGTSDTTFSPVANMTRAMFVAVLARVDGQSLSNDAAPFSDVASGAWYAGAVKWASNYVIVSGVGGGRFDPNGFVTRQQMATIMARYIAYYAAKNKVTFKATGSTAAFTDAVQIADYAKSAVTLCRSYGLVDGNTDGAFAPEALSTRAQVAAVIHRLALLLATGTPVTTPSGGNGGSGSTSSNVTANTAADFVKAAEANAASVTATIADDNNLTVNDDVTINASAATLTLNLGKASLGNLTVNAPSTTKIDITGSGSVASLTIDAPNATVNNGVKVNGSVNIQAVSGSTFNNTASTGIITFSGTGALNDTQTNPAPVVVATAAAVAVRGNSTNISVTADNAQLTVAPASNTVNPVVDSSADGVKVTVANDNPVTVSGQVAEVKAVSTAPSLTVEAAVGTLTAPNAQTLTVSGKGSVETMDSSSAAVTVVNTSAVSIDKLTTTGGTITAPDNAISTVEASGSVTLNASVNTVKADADTALTLASDTTVNTVAASGSLTVGGAGSINSIDVASTDTTATITKAADATVAVAQVTTAGAAVTTTVVDKVVTKAATPTTVMFNAPTVARGQGTITGVTAAMEYKSSTGDWTAISGTTVTGVAAGSYEVRVKATSTALSSEAVTGAIPAAVAVTTAAIQGTPYVGQPLTAVANASATGTLSYVWKAGSDVISGANGKALALTDAQIGKAITVTISNYGAVGTPSTPTDTVTVDKTALKTLIAKAAEIQQGVTEKADGTTAATVAKGIVFVTTSEKTALTTAVSAATTVANNANADTKTVSDAETALRTANDAYSKAKKVGTDDSVATLKAALTALVGQATAAKKDASNNNILTAEKAELVAPDRSWVTSTVANDYDNAISTASGKENSSDAAVLTAAITDLKAAMNTYIKAIQKGAALDRTALDAAVNAAEINAASVEISTVQTCNALLPSQTWVTAEVLGTYNTAIKTAKDKTAAVQNDYISALNALTTATSAFNGAKAPGTKDIVPPTVTLGTVTLTSGTATIKFTSNETGSYKYQLGSTEGTWTDGSNTVTASTETTLTISGMTASFATVYIQVSDESGNATIVSADVGTASENAVASIGAAKYDTLAAALAAATDGQTVKLLKDVTETLTAPTASSLTIDLGTHKLTMSNTTSVVISGDKSLTIQNGSIESKGFTDGTLSNFNIQTNSSIALENVIFDTTGSALYPSGDAARVTVTNSEIKCGVYAVATNAAKVANYNIVITLTGSTFTSTYGYKNDASNKFDSCPVMINVPGTLNMSGCTVNGTRQGVLVRGGTATIQNSTINLTAQYTAGKDLYWSGNWGSGDEVPMAAVVVGNRNPAYQYPATCTLENTVVTAASGYKAVYVYGMDAAARLVKLNIKGSSTNITGEVKMEEAAANAAIVSITGGTFSTDPSAYVAPGYEATNSESGWTVAKIGAESANANVQVGSNYYKTLADAVAAATSGQTVKLLKNLDLDSTHTDYDLSGLTLDLNGKTVTAPNFTHIFVGSNAEIKNGTMFCANGDSYALWLGDAEYTTSGITVSDVTTTGGVNIFNASGITLKNMNVTGTNYYAVWLDEGAFATIESGTYFSTSTEASALLGATATTGSSPVQSVLTVTGGTFNATDTYLSTGNGKINISGGNFTGPVSHDTSTSSGTLSITGGTFSSDPIAYVNTTGYTVTQGTGTTWKVAAKQTT